MTFPYPIGSNRWLPPKTRDVRHSLLINAAGETKNPSPKFGMTTAILSRTVKIHTMLMS